MIKKLSIWIITLVLFGCKDNTTRETTSTIDTIDNSQTPIKNQEQEVRDEETNIPQFVDTILNKQLEVLGLDMDFTVSTNHKPYQISGHFNGDANIDTAIIIWNKKNQKDGLLINYGGSKEFQIFGAGQEVLSQNFDNFNWVGEFYKIDKGEKVASNLEENDEFTVGEISDSLKTTLKSDGIFLHAAESCGGGIIYWANNKYNWIQQE